jgi:hypothetical protein
LHRFLKNFPLPSYQRNSDNVLSNSLQPQFNFFLLRTIVDSFFNRKKFFCFFFSNHQTDFFSLKNKQAVCLFPQKDLKIKIKKSFHFCCFLSNKDFHFSVKKKQLANLDGCFWVCLHLGNTINGVKSNFVCLKQTTDFLTGYAYVFVCPKPKKQGS